MKRNDILGIGMVIIASIAVMGFDVFAGSLNPSSSPASTMYTLSQIFNPLASTSYDSSGFSADQNGSVIEILKYVSANLGWASSSNNVYNLNSKVGIGTSTPVTKFEVQGTASASYFLTGNTFQAGGYATVSYSRFGTAATSHGSMNAANDLLISGELEVNGSAAFDGFALFGSNASISGGLEVSGTASASLLHIGGGSAVSYNRFGTSTTTHTTSIDSANDLLINGSLEVDGSVAFDGFVKFGTHASISGNLEVNITTLSGNSQFVCFSGTATFATLIDCASSIRYKEDIQPLRFNKDNLLAIESVDFKWKDRNERSVGFIAEQVVDYIPELVTYREDGSLQGVNYPLFTPYLLSLLQDHEQQLDALQISSPTITPIFDTIVPEDIHVKTIETETIRVKKGIILEDQVTGDPYCVTIVNGELKAVPGSCDRQNPSIEVVPEDQQNLPTPTPLEHTPEVLVPSPDVSPGASVSG
ncbi:MAG: tail fiber domain-containing protein [Patescibacteria group bacterium]